MAVRVVLLLVLAATGAHANIVEVSVYNSNECPVGSDDLTLEECIYFNNTDPRNGDGRFVEHNESYYPKGCFLMYSAFHWNYHPTGAAHVSTRLFCKQIPTTSTTVTLTTTTTASITTSTGTTMSTITRSSSTTSTGTTSTATATTQTVTTSTGSTISSSSSTTWTATSLTATTTSTTITECWKCNYATVITTNSRCWRCNETEPEPEVSAARGLGCAVLIIVAVSGGVRLV
ncbi:unnamed protein product [Symbiodinium natans]|uniref:Uncharacterized protein n=1 Tax=Symbiodinium natans TaxID=878477 RepID=A0A812TQ88_9DINO|nr:unnamed protein product [Symbiodinium natans]